MKISLFGRETQINFPGISPHVAAAAVQVQVPAEAVRPAVDEVAERVVAQIRAELPDLFMVAVVDTASGIDLASFTSKSSFDPHDAARLNADVVKQKSRALHVFHLDDEQIEDIIITTTSHYHIIKTVNSLKIFIYLAVSAQTVGLGFAREVLRRHALTLIS